MKKNLGAVVVSTVVLLVLAFLLKWDFSGRSFFVPKVNYASAYTLVNDKISVHGAIVVNLPKGVSADGVTANVAFNPVIPGKWVESKIENAVVYKPERGLEVGKHYSVALATEGRLIKKDFAVDEDPAVLNVFPDATAEAELDSAITIVFNRPMVPLTALSELDQKKISVTITPATPGRFKWTSTRTLQFLPSAGLFGSAHYKVQINSGFVSVDGLSVPEKSYAFTTKELRLNSATSNTIIYNEPIKFYFNQPVDLARTLPEISVSDNSLTRPVEFIASYVKQDNKEDKSVISILPKNSLRGHANIWNFATPYSVRIQAVYPVGGDIPLKNGNNIPAVEASVITSPVLENTVVASDKTNLASPALFDPTGTTTFSFYEDIDLGRSSIEVKGLKRIIYGEKCEKEANDNSYSQKNNCKKVEDKSVLIMTFDPSVFVKGETVSVTFNKLINVGGYQVNDKPLVVNLNVYPAFKILKSVPASGDDQASVSDLVFCTNSPLVPQTATEFYKNFKANKYLVFGRWDSPYLQSRNSYEIKPPCNPGDYVNRIHYGLLPTQSYTIQVAITDAFGQKISTVLNLTTGPAPKFYLRFQNLQKIYNVTTPDHTKLTFATENFDYVDVKACKVGPDTMVRLLAKMPSGVVTTPSGNEDCLDSVTKRVVLKKDQWVNQFFQVDLKDYFPDLPAGRQARGGQFVLSFSHPSYKDQDGARLYTQTFLSVTNLVTTSNRVKWTSYNYPEDIPKPTPADSRGSVFWVGDISTLNPLTDARVTLYRNTDPMKMNAPIVYAKSAKTGTSGFVEFPLVADVAGAVVTLNNESAVIAPWTDTLSQNSWSNANVDQKVYLYTDRPIYRPGQQVFLKGLFRIGFDGQFEIFRERDVEIKVTDSRGNEVLTQKVPVSAYGTFSADLKLPGDAPLGSYWISARNQGTSFEVQEYAAAAFEATAAADKDEYLAGDTANLSVAGKYYFGVPLDGGTLDYSITSQNYYFDRYTDGYFNFGSGWYDCYDCGYGDTYLKSGKIDLATDGTAKIKLPLDFGALYKSGGDQSKIFVFHGTIKDKQGKSISFQKSFIVHRGNFYLGVRSDPSYVATEESFKLRVKTVDLKGKPVSQSNITAVVNRVDWNSAKRQEVDGGYYNRYERTLTPVITKNFSTDSKGDHIEELKLASAGEYEINVSGKDSRGNVVKGVTGIYVYGAGTVETRPTNNATLDLKSEKTDLKVGETAKFIIQNPFPHAKAIVAIERGRIFSYELLDLNQTFYEYRFPVVADYAPNVYAAVTLLSPASPAGEAGPSVKYGELQFTIGREEKGLTIDVKSDKQSYLPGEKVNLTVKTTDSANRPLPADVSVAVADLSVLALAGNPKKDPLVFFYDGFPLTVTSETNIKNFLEETPIPTGTKGGDGGSPADLAAKKRGEFKDTAFWQASVVTDNQGLARVTFTLPDNLTKWQIESVGITKDTKLGASYREIVAQKEVMAVPLAPRFVVPGDEFLLGAKIFNRSSSDQSLDISLTSATLQLVDTASTRKTIKAGETATVYFKTKAPVVMAEGIHKFTFVAKNDNYNDTVEISIPIVRNQTYEATATAGSTVATSTSEYLYLPAGQAGLPDSVLKDRGGLTVKTSATLAVYLTDALNFLFRYPYGSAEQIASKLSAISVGKRALRIPNVASKFTLPKVSWDGVDYTADKAVDIGIKQLYDTQTIEGGFSYYKGLKADPYLTIRALNSLADLRDVGFSVRPEVINRATDYLRSFVPLYLSKADTDSLIQLASALSRFNDDSGDISALLSTIESRATTRYLTDQASSNTLSNLAILEARSGHAVEFKNKVYTTLINRVDIDSRGAYVKTNPSNFGWSYYETPEGNTALFLKALVADKRDFSQTDKLITWLASSRAKDGSWGSTNTSVAVIDALTDYLAWKRESESSFDLTVALDEKPISQTSFTKDNIFEMVKKFLPMTDIELGHTYALSFNKTNKNNLPNRFYYDLSLKYYLPVEQIAPRDEGVAITRDFYDLRDTANKASLTSAKVGEVIRGHLTIVSPKERHQLAVEDYIPAGFELVNFNLATEDQTTTTQGQDQGGQFPSVMPPAVIRDTKLYPDFEEKRDDRLFLFVESLSPGIYTYEYYLRATTPGTFSHLPAVASELYFPENFGRTGGTVFTVLP